MEKSLARDFSGAGWLAPLLLAAGLVVAGELGCEPPPTWPPPTWPPSRTAAPEPSAEAASGAPNATAAGGALAAPATAVSDDGGAAASAAPPPAASAAQAPAAGAGEVAPDAAPSAVQVSVVIEQPYKMGQRAQPRTVAAYRADLLERRSWNDGGFGQALAEPPGPLGHPDPRVIVNIAAVRGPHSAAQLERIARQHHWLNVVRCYRLGRNEPNLRGWTSARITVDRQGTVTQAKLLQSELKIAAVAKCLVERLKQLRFPAAGGRSTADVDISVGPGDDPVPLPLDLQVPGPGELPVEAMRRGAEAGLGSFEACYRAAFEYAPELWGRLVIRFHLTAQGQLDEAFQTESRFPDARLLQCVLRAARQLRFERPSQGDIRFEVPLRFFTDRAALPAALAAPGPSPDGGDGPSPDGGDGK